MKNLKVLLIFLLIAAPVTFAVSYFNYGTVLKDALPVALGGGVLGAMFYLIVSKKLKAR